MPAKMIYLFVTLVRHIFIWRDQQYFEQNTETSEIFKWFIYECNSDSVTAAFPEFKLKNSRILVHGTVQTQVSF